MASRRASICYEVDDGQRNLGHTGTSFGVGSELEKGGRAGSLKCRLRNFPGAGVTGPLDLLLGLLAFLARLVAQLPKQGE